MIAACASAQPTMLTRLQPSLQASLDGRRDGASPR